MNKWIVAAAMTLAVPMASAKVLISIDAGAGVSFNGMGDDSNIANDLFVLGSSAIDNGKPSYGLNQEANTGFYGWAKISMPVLPDVKLQYESLVLEGTNNFSVNQDVFGEKFTMNGDITSKLDLSYLDMALTFGLPLPVVDIDFGINARAMLGGFSASESTGSVDDVDAPFSISDNDVPLILPMLYISAGAPIPGAGVTVSGELSTLPLGDTNVTDWNIKGTWYAPLPTSALVKFGLEAGFRHMGMTIGDKTLGSDTSDLASEVSVNRFFLGAAMHF